MMEFKYLEKTCHHNGYISKLGTALIRQFQQKIILEKVTKICTIPIVHSATGQQAPLGTGGGHRG